MDKIVEKLDTIQGDIGEIKISQNSMQKDLEYHIKRTDLLDARIEQVAAVLTPVEQHVTRVEGAVKFIGLLALCITIIAGLARLYKPL